jgi:hypothetical protein
VKWGERNVKMKKTKEDYPEPKWRELAKKEKEEIRMEIEEGIEDIYRLAEKYDCSCSQVAGIKAALNRGKK